MEEGLVTLSVPVRITSRKYVMKMMIDYDDDGDVLVEDDDDVNDASTRQGGCFAANAVL